MNIFNKPKTFPLNLSDHELSILLDALDQLTPEDKDYLGEVEDLHHKIWHFRHVELNNKDSKE